MTIDAGIYQLAGRGVKSVADYDNEYAKTRQNKLAEMMNGAKLDEYQRGIQSQNALRQTLQGFGADQGANQLALMRGGHLKEAQDYAKSNADTGKARADTQYKQLETSHKRLEVIGQGLGFLKDNPSMENAQRVIQGFVQAGIMDPQTAQEKMAAFQADPSPQGVQKLATMGYQGALSTKDQLPTYQTRNTGGTTDTLSINPVTGKVAVANSVQNTQSPESIASNAQSDLNSRRTDARAKLNNETTMSKPFEVTGPDGVPILVRQDKKGNISRVEGFGPKAGAGKALTEAQGNATNFAGRMKSASSLLIPLEEKGVTAGNLGTMAAGSMWTNFMASPEGQQYNQAAKNWVSANLRKESGAAIPESEMAMEIKKYFGIPGDDPTTIAQKRQARAVAEEGMMVQAGPGASTVQATLDKTGAKPAVKSIANDAEFNALPSGAMFIGPDGKTRRKQ